MSIREMKDYLTRHIENDGSNARNDTYHQRQTQQSGLWAKRLWLSSKNSGNHRKGEDGIGVFDARPLSMRDIPRTMPRATGIKTPRYFSRRDHG